MLTRDQVGHHRRWNSEVKVIGDATVAEDRNIDAEVAQPGDTARMNVGHDGTAGVEQPVSRVGSFIILGRFASIGRRSVCPKVLQVRTGEAHDRPGRLSRQEGLGLRVELIQVMSLQSRRSGQGFQRRHTKLQIALDRNGRLARRCEKPFVNPRPFGLVVQDFLDTPQTDQG